MSYKPLSDDNLDWTSHWEARRIYRGVVVEQLKRANALAKAVKGATRLTWHPPSCNKALCDDDACPCCDCGLDDVCEALAVYLGERDP